MEVDKMASIRYGIGDKIYASCHSDFDFGVEVEILGITNLELATEYEDILRKLFNSENAQQSYEELRNNNVYFYICKVLTATLLYKVGDKVVLCDTLIKEKESYYIEQSLNLTLNLSFNIINSPYRYKSDLITDLAKFFNSKNVTNEIIEEKTVEEKTKQELADLHSLINNLKTLKGLDVQLLTAVVKG